MASDRKEAQAIEGYLKHLRRIRDRGSRAIAENWDAVKKERLLSRSILYRFWSFYKAHKTLSGRGRVGTHTGEYFEDIVFFPLRELVTESIPEKDFRFYRDKYLSRTFQIRKRPDIAISEVRNDKEELAAVISLKSWMYTHTWIKVQKEKAFYEGLSPPRIILLHYYLR